jgi:endonuclease G
MNEHRLIKCIITFLILSVSLIGLSQNKSDGLGIPKLKKGEKRICHISYCFVYSEDYELAKWTAYILTKEMCEGDEKRQDDFLPDPEVLTATANNADYKSSGYDRGHLVPAADMTFSEESLAETFFYSNICPQNASFNRGIWKELETEVRDYAKNLEKIYVVTGPIMASKYKTIGKNEVAVPEKFFKAILYFGEDGVQGIAFIMPNKKSDENSVYSYAISIDKLESITNIDFFPKLPFFLEKKAERNCDMEFWLQEGK